LIKAERKKPAVGRGSDLFNVFCGHVAFTACREACR
jgi:hypothetical protein